jgi:very-short-patch-repair endonuclease
MTDNAGAAGATGAPSGAQGVAVRFRCGHGADAADARITLQRACPLCMLIAETKRSRAELLRRVAPAGRAALAGETRIGAEYEWICTRGHSRYTASVNQALTGPGCPKCTKNAQAPAARFEGGVPFMKPGLKTRTSQAEQRLRMLLGERIRLPHRVNAIRISRTFFGKPEVWPDIIIPALRVAIEYDDPGRDKSLHRGLKEASDREKDAALAEVGWEVIRVRSGGLAAPGPHSIVCAGVTGAVVDEIMRQLAGIRGESAVAALLCDRPGG